MPVFVLFVPLDTLCNRNKTKICTAMFLMYTNLNQIIIRIKFIGS
jgi:hypothetical protein